MTQYHMRKVELRLLANLEAQQALANSLTLLLASKEMDKQIISLNEILLQLESSRTGLQERLDQLVTFCGINKQEDSKK